MAELAGKGTPEMPRCGWPSPRAGFRDGRTQRWQDSGTAGIRDGRMRVQLSLHPWLAPGSGRKQRTIIFSQGCFDTRALLSRNAI